MEKVKGEILLDCQKKQGESTQGMLPAPHMVSEQLRKIKKYVASCNILATYPRQKSVLSQSEQLQKFKNYVATCNILAT